MARYLRGLQRPILHGIMGGFFLDAIGLRLGVLAIEFQQARGNDTGFLFGIDDVQLFLKLSKGGAGLLHFCAQFFELPFHELAQAGGCLIADAIGVGQVGLRDVVGHIRCELAVRGAVADLQNISVGWARHLQLLQDNRRLQAGGRFVHGLLRRNLSTTGRSTESDSINFTCVAMN